MNYHRRFHEDGTCEIICVGCFQTLGMANSSTAARTIEARHICVPARAPGASMGLPHPLTGQSAWLQSFSDKSSRISERVRRLSLPIVYACVLFLIYVLPTALEWLASHWTNAWLAVILPGDLTGCLCLAIAFNMRRTSVLLYLVLIACKAFLFSLHLVSPEALVWIVDVVPTLVVAGVIAGLRSAPDLPSTRLA